MARKRRQGKTADEPKAGKPKADDVAPPVAGEVPEPQPASQPDLQAEPTPPHSPNPALTELTPPATDLVEVEEEEEETFQVYYPEFLTLVWFPLVVLFGLGGAYLLVTGNLGWFVQEVSRVAGGRLERLAELDPVDAPASSALSQRLAGLTGPQVRELLPALAGHDELAEEFRALLRSPHLMAQQAGVFFLATCSGTAEQLDAVRYLPILTGFIGREEVLSALADNPEVDVSDLLQRARTHQMRRSLFEVARLKGTRRDFDAVMREIALTQDEGLFYAGMRNLLAFPNLDSKLMIETLACHPLGQGDATMALIMLHDHRFQDVIVDITSHDSPELLRYKLSLYYNCFPAEALNYALYVLQTTLHPARVAVLELVAREKLNDPGIRSRVAKVLQQSQVESTLKAAAEVVGVLRIEEAQDRLVFLLNDANQELRREAARALARIDTRSSWNFLRRRFSRERNCILQTYLFQLLFQAGKVSEGNRPDCTKHCYCGEWGTHFCRGRNAYFCAEHYPGQECEDLRVNPWQSRTTHYHGDQPCNHPH